MFAFALGVGCTASPVDSAVAGCTACELADTNNFSWSGALQVEEWALTAGSDVRLSWAGLTHDLYGNALDPEVDVDRVALLAMPELTPDEVTQALAADDLLASDAALFVFCEPDGTECALSEFELFGNGLEVESYFVEGTGTWVAALLTSADAIGSVGFLLPDDDSALTDVDFTDETSLLTVDVDLQSLDPLVVAAGASVSVDWTDLTTDGLGNNLSVGTLDKLLVGRFDRSAADLEADVYDFESAADPLWTLDVAEPHASLSDLVGGEPFTGVDADGTWLLALYCSSCLNPAPRFATLLSLAPENR